MEVTETDGLAKGNVSAEPTRKMSIIASAENQTEREFLAQLEKLKVFGKDKTSDDPSLERVPENGDDNASVVSGDTEALAPGVEEELNPLNFDEEGINPSLYWFLRCAAFSRIVARSSFFHRYILLCIISAGVLAGIQTYPNLEHNSSITVIENLINISFVLEVILKIWAEGRRPYLYFTGPERKWNIFDFSIVVMSTAPFLSIGNVKFLRLIRLMRLASFFRSIKQLQMIMEGLIGGLKSTVYLVLLMMLIVFMFAEMGIFVFRSNDPWHFSNIETAMITMLRVAAFDNWGEVLYINYYGCDVYPSEYYTSIDSGTVSVLGDKMLCHSPEARPIYASVFFVTFCVLTPFCIFSLFIGTITVSMWDSLNRIKLAELMSPATGLDIEEINQLKRKLFNPTRMDRKARENFKHIRLAFGGNVMTVDKLSTVDEYSPLYYYKILSLKCAKIVETYRFKNIVVFCVVLAAANITMKIDPTTKDLGITFIIDTCVQVVFIVECVLKIVAECETPYMYFLDRWNVFDFFMIIVFYLPGFFEIFRIFRLLRRVVMSRPKLQIIVSALLSGLSSIGFIGVILALYFYVFGLIGTILFGLNDRVGYGTLHRSVLTVFQSVTMDSWSDYMYTNLYGCDVFVGYEGTCPEPTASWYLSSLFFVSLLIIGQLVLLSLFIGVISMSMDEAHDKHKSRVIVNEKVKRIELAGKLDVPVSFYYNVFKKIDYSQRKLVGKAEVQFGMNIAGIELSKGEFEFVWDRVDVNHSGSLDFSEFLEFMIDLRERKKIKMEEESNRAPGPRKSVQGPDREKRNSKLLLSYFNYSSAKGSALSNAKSAERENAAEIDYFNAPFQSRLGSLDVMQSVKNKRKGKVSKQESRSYIGMRKSRELNAAIAFDYKSRKLSAVASAGDAFIRARNCQNITRVSSASTSLSRFKVVDPLQFKNKSFPVDKDKEISVGSSMLNAAANVRREELFTNVKDDKVVLEDESTTCEPGKDDDVHQFDATSDVLVVHEADVNEKSGVSSEETLFTATLHSDPISAATISKSPVGCESEEDLGASEMSLVDIEGPTGGGSVMALAEVNFVSLEDLQGLNSVTSI